MVEISLWLDLIQYSRKDPVALQLIGSPGEAPMFSLVLSGLADGTFLPPLLFFGRSLPPLPSGFPDNVLLEARPEGLQDLDMQRTWIHKVGLLTSWVLSDLQAEIAMGQRSCSLGCPVHQVDQTRLEQNFLLAASSAVF